MVLMVVSWGSIFKFAATWTNAFADAAAAATATTAASVAIIIIVGMFGLFSDFCSVCFCLSFSSFQFNKHLCM